MPTGIYQHKKGYKHTEEAKRKMRKARKGEMPNFKHGHSRKRKETKTYWVWGTMLQRCNNSNSKRYKYYGGRGITVCERWNSFINFLADMGECPKGFVMDRIDNDGNYEPTNCRWTDTTTSSRNKRAPKLSMDKANEIRESYSDGYLLREIAERFNICCSMVSNIVNNKRWRTIQTKGGVNDNQRIYRNV